MNKKEMLERELRGIHLELQVARSAHIKDTQTIVDLERERADLVDELDRLYPEEAPVAGEGWNSIW